MSEEISYDNIDQRDSITRISTCFIDSHMYLPFEHPKIGATIYCSRKPGYYIFNAYFLILLITVSALTVFGMDCKLPQNRLQTTCTIMLTGVSFKWVINRYLPTVSYLTSLDQYSIAGTTFVCALAIWHGVVGRFWSHDTAQSYDNIAFWVFSSILVVINVTFTYVFIIAQARITKLRRKEHEFLRKFRDALKREHHHPF